MKPKENDEDFTDKKIARFDCINCKYCIKDEGRCSQSVDEEHWGRKLIRHLKTCPLSYEQREKLKLHEIKNSVNYTIDLRAKRTAYINDNEEDDDNE